MKQHAPATERNREPIRDVLARVLPAHGTVLEIASGTGEHAVAFAAAFPHLTWQPSDPDATARASIAAYRAEADLANLRAPVELDVLAPWPATAHDPALTAIVCINMVHISPWEASIALFAGAGAWLPRQGVLYLYGPYRFDGQTAPSNLEFEQWLKARDPRFGVRDVRDLETLAHDHGLVLADTIAMPANNHSLVFERT